MRDESIGGSNPFKWLDVTSDSLFQKKRVVLFGLPGAFTPTCSVKQVPGYEKLYSDIRAQGIDEIYCLSVNDAFVMYQWGLNLGIKNVKLLPDGACRFTRAINMSCVWDSNRGFGERSWRYSAVINDMVVEKLFVEGGGVTQNFKDDPYTVSDPDTMLAYLKSVGKK